MVLPAGVLEARAAVVHALRRFGFTCCSDVLAMDRDSESKFTSEPRRGVTRLSGAFIKSMGSQGTSLIVGSPFHKNTNAKV